MTRAVSLCAVILAAGESTRMGRDKALLPWPPPSPASQATSGTFLSAAIRSLAPFSELVIVVAGKNEANLQAVAYAEGASLVRNPEPERGQFSSLQTGLHEVLNRGRDAAMVTLVDRPPVSPSTLQALCDAFNTAIAEGKWAVVPENEGRHGHPILMGREMMEAFLRAPATASARDIQHQHQIRIQYLAVNDPRIRTNVDTPQDYADLSSSG